MTKMFAILMSKICRKCHCFPGGLRATKHPKATGETFYLYLWAHSISTPTTSSFSSSVTLKFLKTRLQLVNILFYSPIYNRSGLTGWIKAAQPTQAYAGFGRFDFPGLGYPGGLGYGASAPQYPQLNYPSNFPQLPSAPILYPQSSYPQPYAQPYPQPVYSPMSNQLQVYSPMINRFPRGYFPY